jgi:hypothetical protein
MPAFSTYRLTFRSPLHIGERGVGLEATRTYVSADTLFSALCSMWRELYGVDALRGDVLDWFTEDEGGNEPFFLSSAFPFAGSVRLFPKPLARLANITGIDSNDKAFKRVRFVSERIFTAMVSGEELTFSKEDCINGKTEWVTKEEMTQLSDWMDNIAGDIMLWKVDIVPRVTLDRITSASEIWHFGEVRFRRFPRKNFLIQVVGAGLIKMSYLGHVGARFNRASTACIAAFPSEMPWSYTLRRSSTTGCSPFQVSFFAHPSLVSASSSFAPFPCHSTRPHHRSSGLYLLWYGG